MPFNKSSKLRNNSIFDPKSTKEVDLQMNNIENRLKKANDYRQSLLVGDKERLSFYKDKVNQINATK